VQNTTVTGSDAPKKKRKKKRIADKRGTKKGIREPSLSTPPHPGVHLANNQVSVLYTLILFIHYWGNSLLPLGFYWPLKRRTAFRNDSMVSVHLQSHLNDESAVLVLHDLCEILMTGIRPRILQGNIKVGLLHFVCGKYVTCQVHHLLLT
jgi:hypothetical protein